MLISSIAVLAYLLSALFDAMAQMYVYREDFFKISRFSTKLYTWDTGLRFPWPIDAHHTYQGIFGWLKTLYIAFFIIIFPNIFWLAFAELGWWVIFRNLFLHKVLTE